MMKHTGFTLIELLIVVAIIGILAAIAVPNFINAQTRAKISRAQADARSVGVALEMYHIDQRAYPPDAYSGVYTHFSLQWGDNPSCGKHLTTPVVYLSTLPVDPFNSLLRQEGFDPHGDAEQHQLALYYLSREYAYTNSAQPWQSGLPFYDRFTGKEYLIYSVGPSLNYGWAGEQTACWMIPYDGSNGLTSQGGIWHLGP